MPIAVRNSLDPNSWRMTLFLDGGHRGQPVDPQYVREVAALLAWCRVTVTDTQPTHMHQATFAWCRVAPLDYRPGVTGTAPLTIADPARMTPQVPNMFFAAVHHPLIVCHEFGHLMGLGHTQEAGRVMSTMVLGPRWSDQEKADVARTAVRFCDHWFRARNGDQFLYRKFLPAPAYMNWAVLPTAPAVAAGVTEIKYECPWGD